LVSFIIEKLHLLPHGCRSVFPYGLVTVFVKLYPVGNGNIVTVISNDGEYERGSKFENFISLGCVSDDKYVYEICHDNGMLDCDS
jgi:hypothetical protein